MPKLPSCGAVGLLAAPAAQTAVLAKAANDKIQIRASETRTMKQSIWDSAFKINY
jgi:hypothetical protein